MNRENDQRLGSLIRFQKLTLQGFKSFPDKVSLEFNSQISAIVGPNGCGKSNILDALRWVLGEQGPSQLRAQSMSDVIFNGSANRKPVGMAEVTLAIECPMGSLPIGYNCIEVTRRLYRSGESEYNLNKTPCRLKDIIDLFLDIGLGKGAYSLIEQGRVDALLMARPIERRGLLEQAAGILKYKNRKKEALTKLTQTEQNLTRVKDVIAEVRSRRIILARQAHKAEKYKALRHEIEELEVSIVAARYANCLNSQTDINKYISELENELARLSAKIGLQAASVQQAKNRVEESAATLQKAQQEYNQMEFKIDATEDKLRDGEQRLHDIQNESMRLRSESESLVSKVTELKRNKTGLGKNCEKLSAEITNKESSTEEYERIVSDIKRQIDKHKNHLNLMKSKHLSFVESASKYRNRKAELEEAIRRVSSRIEKLIQERDRIEENLYQHITNRDTSVSQKQNYLEILETMTSEREGVNDKIRSQEGYINELNGRLQEIESRRMKIVNRYHSLEEIIAAGEGLKNGVKAVLKDYKNHESVNGSIIGLLADLFDTDAEYERAVEAALEERIENIVVTKHSEAERAIQFLSSQQKGRCTFIPIEPKLVNGHGKPSRLPETAKPVIDLIRTENRNMPLFKQLLYNSYLVDDLKTALEIWKMEKEPITLVTTEGEVITPEGIVTGGWESDGVPSYINRKKEMGRLQSEIRNVTKRSDELKCELNRNKEQEKVYRRESDELERQISSTTISIAEISRDVSHSEQQLKQVNLQFEAVLGEIEILQQELNELQRAHQKLTGQSHDEIQVNELEQAISKQEREIDELMEYLDLQNSSLTDVRIALETTRERKNSLLREINQIDSESERLDSLSKRLTIRADEMDQQMIELSAHLQDVKNELESLLRKRPSMEMNIQKLKSQWGQEKLAEESLIHEQETLQKQLRSVESGLTEQRILKAQTESTMKAIQEQTTINLGDIAVKMPEIPNLEELGKWTEQLHVLKRELESLGDVNLTAVEEHCEIVERNKYLDEQLNDLEKSITSLKTTIQQINHISRKKFNEAFENVNRFFGEIFKQLFNGGEAELKLIDPDDPLETGVEILCRPPGKRTRTIDLLSGGEKALSALALLFASFQYKPSPILFLDEVDASLDDANILRFTEYLKELSITTQVMMISHNPLTVEIADILYGITMADPGISKLVAVKIAA
ncbi:chromosome segregation protein SMC [bacterium]|nr:chromosome segregation protein SMC [candidate division CSSED10-310 bacterium]